MSMLAERRRKQKWALDPRNTRWSNDDSKFGQRMLEKMGWSKGKGLGAQEQGATEHIKVQVKNNHLGLGATINNEDNWIAHQDDFNQLLAELNTCHGPETADSSDKEKKSFSLEEKSKVSKNRVHYKKFTKGRTSVVFLCGFRSGLLSTPTCCRTEDRPCWPFSPFEERLKGRTYRLGAEQIWTAFLGKDRVRRLPRMIPVPPLQMGMKTPLRQPAPSPSRSTLPSGWQS
uniref:PIN2 (TERF1) interacting telomerase inhibitor 1 n=1 Tax=Myotis myotis TaxID=51298 RepID=A0A7J7XK30_MYOMY|nr:PIN2 (TERF1) interacting telomerase inhibitor 1 [Myotis myotis]